VAETRQVADRAVPDEASLAGASAELARSLVYADRTEPLPDLEETLVSLHLAVLAGRTWPSERGLTWPSERGLAWPSEPGRTWPPDRES
jgi:hypothetical protein